MKEKQAMIPNTFDLKTKEENLKRLENISIETQTKWGKMNTPQVLAHLTVAYELALNENTPINRGFKRFIISLMAKKMVVGEKPYPKNGMTSPDFKISDQRDFAIEKAKLATNINTVFEKGAKYFDGKESQSFGPLSEKEWSNLFQKHLNHHLEQLGV